MATMIAGVGAVLAAISAAVAAGIAWGQIKTLVSVIVPRLDRLESKVDSLAHKAEIQSLSKRVRDLEMALSHLQGKSGN